jgi:hypothetical protein
MGLVCELGPPPREGSASCVGWESRTPPAGATQSSKCKKTAIALLDRWQSTRQI